MRMSPVRGTWEVCSTLGSADFLHSFLPIFKYTLCLRIAEGPVMY